MDHYINTAATDISRARTVGLQNLQPAPFPVLTVGNQTTQRFFFANRGALESWSGDGTYSLRLTVAKAQSGPTDGTWTFTVGTNPAITLPFDLDAAGLEFALNNDATIIAEGGVRVEQAAPGFFLIAWKSLGTVVAFAADASLLEPDCTAELVTLATGSSSIRNYVLLNLRRNLSQQLTTFTTVSSPVAGWTGVLDLNTAAAFELLRQLGEMIDEFLECDALLTLEVTDPLGNRAAFYQTPVTLRAINYSVAASQTSLPVPIGPTFHASTNNSGDTTVTLLSRIHTEFITIGGSARTSRIVLSGTGLSGVNATAALRFLLPATDAIALTVYDQSTGGTLLATVNTDAGGFTPSALLTFIWDGSNFRRVEESIPSFGQQS